MALIRQKGVESNIVIFSVVAGLPPPIVLSRMSPENAFDNSGPVTLTVLTTENRFNAQCRIHVNNFPRPDSQYVNQNTLAIPGFLAGNLGPPGEYMFDVREGQRNSNQLVFTLNAAVILPPHINSLIPDTARINANILLQVIGRNFDPTSKIYFDGVELTTVFVTAEDLRTTIFSVGGVGNKLVQVKDARGGTTEMTMKVK